MRASISLMTAAAFLLHMVLGCCIHHAHAAGDTPCRGECSKSPTHSHAEHDHASQSPHEDAPWEAPRPGERCNEAKCVFVATAKSLLPELVDAAVFPALANDLRALQHETPNVVFVDTGGAFALPLRLHLFNQVLLL